MRKKGFTLIELLAVIVILAVIALIATPLIMGVINNARKNSFKDSAYGIMKAVELKAMEAEQDPTTTGGPYKINVTTDYINYSGEKPTKGWAKVDSDGNVTLYMTNDTYWAYKDSTTGNEVIITTTSKETEMDVIKTDNTLTELIKASQCTETNEKSTYNFAYTGGYQTFIAPLTGNYKIELWGAEGGAGSADGHNFIFPGGRGAYVTGNIRITKCSKLYVYVGALGENHLWNDEAPSDVSFNGGGTGGYDRSTGNDSDSGGSGGGATDIRLVNGSWDSFDSLKTRIMIASGGGGGVWNAYSPSQGQNGGGLYVKDMYVNGHHNTSIIISDGTQVSGYKFGIGANKDVTPESSAGGGGGGYYTANVDGLVQGTGGTSFISGYQGCDAISSTSTENNIIHTSQPVHYSGYQFTDTIMIDGTGCDWKTGSATNCGENQPQPDGTFTAGHSGNGFARITFIG